MSIQSPAEKPKKRLLFLSAAYRQHGTKLAVGGVATHVESLAQALAATGRFAIDIVCGGTFDTPTARTLRLSEQAVHNHRAAVMAKLGLQDRVELLRYALRRGLVRGSEL